MIPEDKYDELFHVLINGMGSFSRKQAEWFMAELPKAGKDILGFAKLFVIARRYGPDLTPFNASDKEIEEEARKFLDEGFSELFVHNRGGQK